MYLLVVGGQKTRQQTLLQAGAAHNDIILAVSQGRVFLALQGDIGRGFHVVLMKAMGNAVLEGIGGGMRTIDGQ